MSVHRRYSPTTSKTFLFWAETPTAKTRLRRGSSIIGLASILQELFSPRILRCLEYGCCGLHVTSVCGLLKAVLFFFLMLSEWQSWWLQKNAFLISTFQFEVDRSGSRTEQQSSSKPIMMLWCTDKRQVPAHPRSVTYLIALAVFLFRLYDLQNFRSDQLS